VLTSSEYHRGRQELLLVQIRVRQVLVQVPALKRPGYNSAMAAGGDERKLAAAEDETRFWALLDAAWTPLGHDVSQARQALAGRAPGSSVDTSIVEKACAAFLDGLTSQCRGLPDDELVSLDGVLERKLYDIDRADIHAVTDGSDDGFLYARGFIVAMGREFYDAVAGDPQMAVLGAQCERMCYFFAHLYRERSGRFPDTHSGISRESFQNRAGWVS
jgi:hypothetical protein